MRLTKLNRRVTSLRSAERSSQARRSPIALAILPGEGKEEDKKKAAGY
jgi:hypothetical protein